MVMKRIDKLCYFNVAQFRQAVSNVVKCQTDFFPSNTVRHEFAFKFEQFSRKLTTYRSLLVSHHLTLDNFSKSFFAKIIFRISVLNWK